MSGPLCPSDARCGDASPCRRTPGRTSRRRLLGLGVTAGLALTASAAGCSLDGRGSPGLPDLPGTRERPSCVPGSALPRYRSLAGSPLGYEVSRRRAGFAIDEGFADQLEAWLADLIEQAGWRPRQLWTYGTWTNGGGSCDSWHNAGRAFDLARLRLAGGGEVSCRYDLWRTATGRDASSASRRYWALAASAHKHFAYVLTYLYNARHHNHIHLDNGRSGSQPSVFSARSTAQVQAVQGICTHLWQAPVEITGRWDAATRAAVGRVLDGLHLGSDLTDQPVWSSFLDASTRRGAEPS